MHEMENSQSTETVLDGEEDQVTTLSKVIEDVFVESLRLVCYGLEDLSLESDATLLDIYYALKTYFKGDHREAVTFIHQVLIELGYQHETCRCLGRYSIHRSQYNVRVQHPNVDMRLTSLELTKTLEEKGMVDILKEHLRDKENISYDKMGDSVLLVSALFSEKRVKEIGDLHKIAKCFNCEAVTAGFFKRRKLSDSTVELDILSSSSLDVSALQSRVSAFRKEDRKSKIVRYCQSAFCLLLIVVAIMLVIIGVVLVVTRPIFTNGTVVSGYLNASDESVVSLDPNGISGVVDAIGLTLETNNDEVEVEVYKQTPSNVIVSEVPLEPQPIPPFYTEYFKRQPCNYNGQDKPIYGVNGSVLEFNVSASLNQTNPRCLKIHIFRDRDLYMNAVTINKENNLTQVDGAVAHSHCLPIGTPSVALGSWRYTFNETGYVYATIDEGPFVNIAGNISGSIKCYNVRSLVPVCIDESTLTTNHKNCEVRICSKPCLSQKKPIPLVFLKSKDPTVKTQVKYIIRSSVFMLKDLILDIILFVLAIVLLVCFIAASYCFCKGRKPATRKHQGKNYNMLVKQSS